MSWFGPRHLYKVFCLNFSLHVSFATLLRYGTTVEMREFAVMMACEENCDYVVCVFCGWSHAYCDNRTLSAAGPSLSTSNLTGSLYWYFRPHTWPKTTLWLGTYIQRHFRDQRRQIVGRGSRPDHRVRLFPQISDSE